MRVCPPICMCVHPQDGFMSGISLRSKCFLCLPFCLRLRIYFRPRIFLCFCFYLHLGLYFRPCIHFYPHCQ